MDDSCAVCAETLEWVAYGQCGHREVCSTCIARLRFICDDHSCCLCKSNSNMVFVTKALGDYTRVISDFSVFPSEPTEGKVGPYWYHEATEAFFDDPDHYKMIKAMCRLSCILCDKIDEQGNESSKRRGNFRNVEQLKDHLFYRHKLFMCNLCLEGRKIFICEQKLYTREQLNQHINTGDSEVDGSETERGGFMGHPMCEFCRNPFYGENELYTHMSTEHYTCHICHRQHPGHYEYYRNYDELEIHFRRDHILCEDEGCLAKKFIVFLSESELKRHNAMEHGGHMSRSKRNVALQIPTSFKYERSIEQDSRRRRGHGFHSDYSESELTMAVQASLVTINSDMSRATSSGVLANSNLGEEVVTDSSFRPLELLATTDSDAPSRYTRNAQGQTSRNAPLEGSSFPPLPVSTRSNQQNSRNKSKGLGKNTMTSRKAPLEGSSFPPLPVSTRSNQQNSRNKSKGLGKNTMAACLRSQNNVAVLHSSRGWPAVDRQPTASMSNILQPRHTSASGFASSSASTSSSLSKAAIGSAVVPPNHASFAKSISVASQERVSASSDRSSINITGTTKLKHSALTPNLVGRGAFDCSKNNFPPVSETNTKKATTSSQSLVKVEDTHVANKFLIEKIRAGLQFDNDRYAVFKVISGEYRQGLIETGEYVAYVHQFGLSHLIPELARLCPDAKKQEELLEACNTSMGSNGPSENSAGKNNIQLKQNKVNKKGKEKLEGKGTSTSKPDLADSIISSVRELQSSHRPSEEEVEILSKDGYRSMKGKSKVLVVDEQSSSSFTDRTSIECTGQNDSTSAGGSSKKTVGGNKPRKKTSKFHRVRLGENSPAALLGLANSDSTLDHPQEESDRSNGPKKLPVGGVWRDGGGRKLVAKLQ